MTGPAESNRGRPPAVPLTGASRSLFGPSIALGVVLGLIGIVFTVTVAVQVSAPGDAGLWVALLLVAVGAVMGYRRARAKGHRDLGIGLLIGIAAGLVAGFGAMLAVAATILGNFT